MGWQSNMSMKTSLLLFVVMVFSAHARIGENPSQIAKRFGKPVAENNDAIEPIRIYETDALRITCLFRRNRCIYECYEKRGVAVDETSYANLDLETAQKILLTVSDGKPWTIKEVPPGERALERNEFVKWTLGELQSYFASGSYQYRGNGIRHGFLLCVFEPLYLTTTAFKIGGGAIGEGFLFVPPAKIDKIKKTDPTNGL
jgi:hypothetical protein